MAWSDTFLQVLKDNDVRLVTYVPDNVLTPLLTGVTSDNYLPLGLHHPRGRGDRRRRRRLDGRHEERGDDADLGVRADRQCARLAHRAVADPCVMVISEHGTMGEVNVGQHLVARTMRPVLDTLGIAHHTLDDEATMPFIVDRSIKQAFMTQASVAFILSPLLTGGNPAANAKLKSAS